MCRDHNGERIRDISSHVYCKPGMQLRLNNCKQVLEELAYDCRAKSRLTSIANHCRANLGQLQGVRL